MIKLEMELLRLVMDGIEEGSIIIDNDFRSVTFEPRSKRVILDSGVCRDEFVLTMDNNVVQYCYSGGSVCGAYIWEIIEGKLVRLEDYSVEE